MQPPESSILLNDFDQKGQMAPTISYLQQEISHLNDKIADLEETVRLTKNSLKVSLSLNQKSGTTDKFNSEIEKSLRQIISNLEEENLQYQQTVGKLQTQSDYYQSRALINEQIIGQSQKHRLELEADFEEKFRVLQMQLLEKENKIRELEKQKPEMEADGVIVKYREILLPSQQVIVFQQEYNSLKQVVCHTMKEIQRLNNEKKEILAINFSITNELSQLKALVTNSKTISLEQKDSISTNVLIDLHKKFLDTSNSSDSSRRDDQQAMPNLNSPKQEKSAGLNHSINNPKMFIPKLDLTQAKKIQEYNAKRTSPQVNNNLDNKLAEKLQGFEKEIEKTKNLLAKEMCNNTLLREENDKLRKEILELRQKIRLLVNSQHLIESNYEKVKGENSRLKEFCTSTTGKSKNHELSKSFCQGNNFAAFHTSHYDDKYNFNISLDSSVDPEKKSWKNYLREMDKQLVGLRSAKKNTNNVFQRKNSE